jgi:predicted nucleic acid binding AN1-type Zn finger protein
MNKNKISIILSTFVIFTSIDLIYLTSIKSVFDKQIYIISSVNMLKFVENTIKIDIKLKKNGTCLHLSPYIALQRKGGSETDNSPNHIQAKLKITQELLELCNKIL